MRELSDGEIETVLARNGIGVLALYDGAFPYPIPMSFGYSGASPVFAMQFGFDEHSRKRQCLETTSNAGFTVYEETEPNERWRSVVLTGELTEVSEADLEAAYMALASNATFAPDVGVWSVPFEEAEHDLYTLEIDEWRGREFSMTTG